MIKRMLSKGLPRAIGASILNYKILSFDFGQAQTIREWKCVDRYGNPIPWYTYSAIEYIKQLDFSDKRIFEFGSGYSTIFWADRCKCVVSVEDNQEWYDRICKKVPDNVEYLLLRDKREYVESVSKYTHQFDIIVIDGHHRYDCALEARKKLKDDGFMILDNSDWYEKTSKYLRESGLIEVDMFGFGPINAYTWVTSFYFTRNVILKSAYERQPIHGIGGLKHIEE